MWVGIFLFHDGLYRSAVPPFGRGQAALIRGSRSDHSRAAQAYIEAGETPENARRLAWRDDVLDVLWAGYGGAVSGGLSAAAYGGAGTLQNIQEVKQIGQAYLTEGSDGKTRLGDAMEIGLSNATGTEALETAQRIQSQLQQGKQPTAYQIGKMLLESTTPRAMRARVIEADILDSARENGVDDKTARSVAALMVRADRAARFVSPEALQTTGENGGSYSILTDANGLVYVQADESIVPAGATDKDIAPILSDIIQNKFHNLIQANGQNIGINAITSREWRFSKDATRLLSANPSAYEAKTEIFNNADEILRAAHSWINEQAKHKSSRGFVNFGRGQVAFKVGDQGYSADVIVGIKSSGNAYLYDLVNIRKIKIKGTSNTDAVAVNNETRRGDVPSDTRIPQNGAGVNTQYMQNSGENAPVYQAAGRYTADGVVELASNITTDEAMDFVIKHELTHAIEGSAAYGKLKRLVQQSLGEAEYAAAVERERQSRSAKGDAQGAAGAEAEVIADWVGENLYNGDIGTGFARMIRNMDRGAAVQFQAILDGFRQTLGLTKSYRQAAALRSAERAFAEVLDSDYSSANEYTAAETGDGGKYALRTGAREEVERVLDGEQVRGDVQLTDTSPAIIVEQKGARNLPLMMKASHIRENVFSESEARERGLQTGKKIHYHGLGKDLFLQTIDGLNDVTVAYRGTKNADDPTRRENYFLLVSQYKDADGNIINVPVYINETGQYNEVFVDTNKLATVFGRENFYQYVDRQVQNGNLVRIKRKSTQASERTGSLPDGYSKSALSNTKIPQNGSGVNTQSMQNSENNSSDGQKSYLPADLQERESAAAEKAENARRLAEEQSEKQRQQETQIRRQREETAGELRRQNAELRKRLERAQRETRLTTDKTVREEDVAKLTRRILREYSSTLKSDSILDAMQTLGDTIVQGEQLNDDTLHGQALDIARQIVDHSEALIDDGEGATYDGIRQYLRENKIAVSEAEKADIQDYEAWRRRNQRRLNLSKEGTPVDVIYGEMQELFGKGLLPDILNPSEQLQYLAKLRDNMEPEYGNPYDSDMEQAAEACAGDILDGMLSAQVRQTSPTYADKAQAQLERQKNLAHAALEREVQRRHRALETQRNRYRDLLTRERVRTAEARVQGENAVRETKAENRQRNREAAERRKRTAEKQRVGRMLDSLEAMLAHPDKNHHIPVAATEAVRDLLATVREDPGDIQAQINELQLRLQDTSDGRQIARIRRRIAERQARLDKTTSLYEAVSKVQDRYGDIAGKTLDDKPGNPGFQHYLQEIKEMVNGRTVSDLSAAEMHELVEVMKAVHGQLKQMNTLHGKGFREGAQETGLHMAEV